MATDSPDWAAEYEAPAGQVWVCGACGREGKNRARLKDSSCFSNSTLCYAEKVDGVWKAVEDADHQGEARDESVLGQRSTSPES